MKRSVKKIFALVCSAVLLFSACGGESTDVWSGEFDKYPIETEIKLTYWGSMPTAVSTVYDNFGKTEFAKNLEKNTGVTVEYIHPTAGQEDTSLSLMIASDELPDMIETNWLKYGGGATSSLEEEIIIPLNDLIDKHAPNLKKFLQENPEIEKMVKTDEGNYYVFPFIRPEEKLLISAGNLVRNDWLEELGLEEPKTIADLENVLVAFRDKKGATAPLSFRPSHRSRFLGNFSTSAGFYLENGKIVYGPMTENYKTAVMTMKSWYDKGLLDANFVSADDTTVTTNVLNGKTGVTVQSGGGGLGTWLDTMNGKDWSMTGMPFTTISNEDPFFQIDNPYPGYGSVAITTACKNPELAVRWLDYAYSEEGYVLYNFGTEGVSYEKTDDGYKFTDNIFNNPDGLTMAQAMSKYFKSSTSGPFVQSGDYIDQFYYRPQQQQALDAWTQNIGKVKNRNLPPISMNKDEASEYANIMAEVSQYEAKMFTEFILGTTPMSEFDTFIAELKNLGIDRAIAVQEAAYKRYNNR